MNAYLDSSVILRRVLLQPEPLSQWGELEAGVTSVLTEVECLRTLDRMRLRGVLADSLLAERRGELFGVLKVLDVIALSPGILRRAADAFPTALGTLDALHLASALQWRAERDDTITLATHDGALAQAARACGVPVIGV